MAACVEILYDDIIMTGGFLITIEDTKTSASRFKARFVIQSSRDKDENKLFHTTTTAKYPSTWLLITLAAYFGFRIRL